MEPNVEQLLGGPRGRRLCLELAMEMDQDIRIALFHLGFNLDPGAGRSRKMLTMSPYGEAPPPPPEPTVNELAAMITSLDLTGITNGQVQKALERAVDTARYWQEPDGEDVLAAAPATSRALAHVAGGVLRTSAAESWTRESQVRQWAIDWRSSEDPAPLPGNPRQKLAEWARNQRAGEVRAAWERPADIRANVGGEWWSIPHGLIQTVARIPEGLSLVEDSLGWEEATTIAVSGTGRILEIRTEEDWTKLCRAFPLEVTASRRHDWFRTTGRHGRWVIPDWERASSRWDAVHLTVVGYLRLAGRALTVDEGTASVIAGWNPDSTFWLNDVVRESGEPRQHWHREHNQDEWELASGD
ncbi:hypothetical protein FQP90_01075 [Paenarthrobacter nitroguajacolicus]|uniref:Uncharacterized protein n=1 Tax=Paenarthrobacter nitroguajacolicus TaxID=211146 RepID=A0A558HCA9_PAENT|nr:hypothetical protein [Paenarthrobacter nitroguajacolicus]TVU66766.1 hypothetical protein FQP90_01075 [Paenarthrobacter nitroguajacolicus]